MVYNPSAMARAIAYKCKTPDCGTWLKMQVVPDDLVLKIGDPLRITCPVCKQGYDYSPAEKELVKTTD